MPSETKLPDSVIGVIATATMPTIDALRRIARMLSTVRKFGVRATATMTATATAPTTSASRRRAPRAGVARGLRRVGGHARATAARHAASSLVMHHLAHEVLLGPFVVRPIEVSRPR